ncbi:MAG: hypothetical protein QXY90_05845 [Candidatus Anstonellales archaeon]
MSIPVHGWQYEMIDCPFCKKCGVSCMWFPAAVSVKRNVTASLPGQGSLSKSRETWIIKSGCLECGKTQEEVEKRLKQEGIII